MAATGFAIDPDLRAFIDCEALPGTGVEPSAFWRGFEALIRDLTPENRRVLARRAELQHLIDRRNEALTGAIPSPAQEEAFLREIGYLADAPGAFTIGTSGVDPEVAQIAGPQLVVPVNNARYSLNAANARWGSLYDALYGTDVLGDGPPDGGYDEARGARVIAWGKAFLDRAVPLAQGSWADLRDVSRGIAIRDESQYVGRTEHSFLFRNHGLHIETLFDGNHPVGRSDPIHLADIILESAVTAIMDCEDSVAAVDAEEKIGVYRNWLGLMRGDLSASATKGGRTIERRLNPDREYRTPGGGTVTLKGRSLMFVRTVGHLMTNPILHLDGEEVFEGLADTVITALIALHDVRGARANSRAGSTYIVKPKMHGPEEAAFANLLFDRTEDLLGLPRHSIKIGVMDEERRTSLNLASVIHEVRERVAFINTGFLDRTGDEIHTSMRLGPVIPKGEMKTAAWFKAYEDNNVDVGLACGFIGRGQIGKGMWAMPDRMRDMMEQKIAHPLAAATAAWVPSPTAATLHAIHYHRVDVRARQLEAAERRRVEVAEMLALPVSPDRPWSPQQLQAELDNNVQGILGYVVRWVGQGIGCSKVPDISDVGLMEDRATCRISSQHIANWLLHGVVTREQVEQALRRMAAVVDAQNVDDEGYRPMSLNLAHDQAYQAASALIFEGAAQPSGYTEPLLHAHRLALKAKSAAPIRSSGLLPHGSALQPRP